MLNNGVLDLHLGSYGLKRVGHFDECGGLCYDQGVFKWIQNFEEQLLSEQCKLNIQ